MIKYNFLFFIFLFSFLYAQKNIIKHDTSLEYNNALKAIYNNKFYSFVSEISRIKNINEKDKLGNTLLHYAIKNNLIQYVKWIFRYHSVNVNTKNNLGYTPLGVAIKYHNIHLIDYLISQGAEVEYVSKDRDSALLLSVYGAGEEVILSMMHKFPFLLNHKNNKGVTSLHIAAYRGMKKVVKYLLEHHASVNVQDQDGITPLHYAAARNHTNIIKILHSYHVNIDISDKKGNTPLYNAVIEGKVFAVSLLLKYGANINFQNQEHQNLLQIAVFNQQYKVAWFLYKNYPNLALLLDNKKQDILFYLIHNNWIRFAKKLDIECFINNQNNNGQTPIMYAVILKRRHFITWLKKIKLIKWNLIDKYGNNIIHYAIKFREHRLLYFLKKKRELFLHKNNQENLPLWDAIQKNDGVVFYFYLKYFSLVFDNKDTMLKYYNTLKKNHRYYLARKIKKSYYD